MTRLSPREREIVELVGGEGLGYKIAAARLKISVATVRTYVQRIRHRAQLDRSPRDAMVVVYERDVVAIADSEIADY